MSRKSVLLPWLAAIASPSRGAPAAPDWADQGRRWWSHVQVLADNSMEGRETGSPGYHRAANYVIQQFQAAGLEPAGEEGYLQPVNFRVMQIDQARSSLELATRDGVHHVALGTEASYVVTSATREQADVDAVFVGYGLSSPELNVDDLAGLDLRGKVAVLVRGGPTDMPAPVKAHLQSLEYRANALRRAGALGVVSILNPRIPELPWPRFASGLLMPRMELLDPGPDGFHPLPITIMFNPEHAGVLFEGSGHTLQEVFAGLGSNARLPRFPLAVRLRVRVNLTRGSTTCHNVVGVLPGSDPRLKGEFVAVSAHLDHLGVGTPINGDPIYHGAIDNASGVASILEIARSIHDSGASPRRSILFLAVTGEEKGLLGSAFFAAHPSVHGPIVANINLDVVWSMFPLRALEVLGVDESTLGDDIRALADHTGVKIHTEYEPDRVLFIRSDQYNFIKRGVPALAPAIGYFPGSAEEKLAHQWIEHRYHSPADDASQPVDPEAAAQFNDLERRLVIRIADADERPSWKPESFFRRFAR